MHVETSDTFSFVRVMEITDYSRFHAELLLANPAIRWQEAPQKTATLKQRLYCSTRKPESKQCDGKGMI
jgi:hypothetical protein